MGKYTGTFPNIYEVIDYGQKIGEEANRLAYPNNPKIAQYPGGKPTPQFKSTLSAVSKNVKFWNAWSRLGASCDVFTGTCVRAVYDKNCPLSLSHIEKYMSSKPEYVRVNVTPETIQDGDIILYRKNLLGWHGHVCIHYKGKVKEAGAHKYYGRTANALKNRLSLDGKKWVHVYRVKNSKIYTPLKRDSRGLEVKRLQKFLNWYFADDKDLSPLKVDGIFGPLTTGRVKLLQNTFGIVIDGIVGVKTLAKMKEVKK